MDTMTTTRRIEQIYCWIATYEDGSEGIIGGLPDVGMMPMLSSRRYAAEAMEASARQAMRLSQHSKHPVASIRLATFVVAEEPS